MYIHIFPNGKKYVGITSQPVERRWRANGEGYRSQEMITRAILKYGWENISHEIIATGISKEKAEELERKYIKEYQTSDRDKGYNIEFGGYSSKGYRLSEETRKRMSEARKGKKNHNYGKHLSDETKRKLSEAHKGKKMNRESINRSIQKRMGANAYNARKVYQYNLNGEYLAEYETLVEAGRATNTRPQDIHDCCIGRYKKTHGNIWRYADERA